MANDVKWFKFMNGMFDDEKIEYIESLPDGDAILIIWIRILCLASKSNENGSLMITNELPYTPELLAHKFKKTTTQIEYALGVMQKLGMIEIIDNIICVSNWAKYQSVDELAKIREQTRLRVAKCRGNKKLEMNCTICQYCGSSATGFDHIIATSRGGSDKDENKVPCCIECNRIKNDKPLVDFLNNNRGRINDNIVTANKKLSRFVELCSVTGCYIVTQNCNDFALISNSSSSSNNSKSNDYKEIVDYLNNKINASYKYTTKKTQQLINARKKEGFSVEDFKKVIDNMFAKWNGTEYEQYLRPETLFGTKFEGYLNQQPIKQNTQKKYGDGSAYEFTD